MSSDCPLCRQVARFRAAENPFFIHEFEHTIAILCDHQFYPGYSIVVLKDHVRDMHELPTEVQQGVFSDVMRMGAAVQAQYRPWKMNYACYGNQDPHIHWHIIPRYESDPQHRAQPWVNSALFDQAKISEAQAEVLSKELRETLLLVEK
jgi:diadenosine tetraphosphate (Ap4A) HIT family hydrolase